MFGSRFVLRAYAGVQSVRSCGVSRFGQGSLFRALLRDLGLVRDVGCVWVKVRTSGIRCGSGCERCRGVYGPKFVPRTSAVGVQPISRV